jgi:hypothetical protein
MDRTIFVKLRRECRKPQGYIGFVSRRRQSVALGVAFVAAIALLAIFGYRAARSAREMLREEQPVHAWMSVPFIAHTHHVHTGVLYAAIGVEPREHDRRPLRFLALQKNRPVGDLIRDLEKAMAKEHAKAP